MLEFGVILRRALNSWVLLLINAVRVKWNVWVTSLATTSYATSPRVALIDIESRAVIHLNSILNLRSRHTSSPWLLLIELDAWREICGVIGNSGKTAAALKSIASKVMSIHKYLLLSNTRTCSLLLNRVRFIRLAHKVNRRIIWSPQAFNQCNDIVHLRMIDVLVRWGFHWLLGISELRSWR